jgi:hypothetical protein
LVAGAADVVLVGQEVDVQQCVRCDEARLAEVKRRLKADANA